MKKEDLKKFDRDNELWDSKQLGASAEHARPVSDEDDKALDDALGLQLLSFRIQKPVIEKLKGLAKLEGIGYQPLMRKILTGWVRENEHRLEQLLTPKEAVEKADKLFALAIKLKEQIPALTPLSNERIFAEGDYNKALTESNALYCHAYEKCADAVLKRHIKLRMSQIGEIVDQELQDPHNEKYGKKKRAV